ncbi:MAG: biotin--[acetyl-CoA-carboxylase] ligase [Methylococcales bacterium]
MVSAQALLKILADGKYHSGVALGKHFGVSRAAIWKVIQKLEKNFKLTVFAVKGKGYKLQNAIELLDKSIIEEQLDKKTKQQLTQLDVFFDIDSTNSYLTIKSIGGAASGYVVLAEQQSNGQGRRGRTWYSPFGSNLYLSLLWRYPYGPAQLGCLSLFIAVAIVRALNKLGISDVGVKWPNDIYWKNKKLAGILLEMRGEANGPSAVVIGLGLNISMKADNVDTENNIGQPWIDLETIMGIKVDRNHFTSSIIDSLVELLNVIPEKKKKLIREWQSMDVLRDEEIEIQFADKVIYGKALGINSDGALKVLHDNKEIVCHSGDVSIRRNK